MRKLIEWIKSYLPVTRKTYLKDMANVAIALQGIEQSEIQHAQIEAGMAQHLNTISAPTGDKTAKPTDKKDVSYQ